MSFSNSYRYASGSGLPYTPPLDAQNAAAAYSIRKLRTDYTGNCIRISDNPTFSGSTKDVGFDSNGYLDISELYTNSYIRTWYDQSGNGLDFIQNSTNKSPLISLSGIVEEVNGIAAMYFNGSNHFLQILSSTSSFNFFHNGSKSSFYFVGQVGDTANPSFQSVLLGNSRGSNDVGINFWYSDISGRNDALIQSGYRGVGGSNAVSYISPNNTFLPNNQFLSVNELDFSDPTLTDRWMTQFNNDSILKGNTQNVGFSTSNADENLTLMAEGSGTNWWTKGFCQELIIYDTDQSANKATLQTNINDYFSIY